MIKGKSIVKRLILSIFVFIILVWGGLYGTVLVDSMLSGNGAKAVSFIECVKAIQENERCRMWFLIFVAIALVLSIWLAIRNNAYYKAKQIKVTDNIYIPAPAGEGQYGTARFMTEKEKRKIYKSFVVDPKNAYINELEEEGRKIYSNIKNIIS